MVLWTGQPETASSSQETDGCPSSEVEAIIGPAPSMEACPRTSSMAKEIEGLDAISGDGKASREEDFSAHGQQYKSRYHSVEQVDARKDEDRREDQRRCHKRAGGSSPCRPVSPDEQVNIPLKVAA